jgi:hypothetical protein
MRLISVFAIAVTLTTATAAFAEPPGQQGNDKERAACHPDVLRYCRELVKDDNNSDVFAILNCLQTNRPKISAACSQVLASHGQ